MKSRRPFLGANWKMHPIPTGALEAGNPFHSNGDVDIVVFPTFLDLKACLDTGLRCGAQAARAEASGTFTGDIGMAMIKAAGALHVLCGHSERRRYHGETDAMAAAQVAAALALGLTPILCIGETAEEHSAGKTKDVLRRQTSILNSQFSILNSGNVIMAYEPVWAISGGDANKPAATSAEAQEVHRFIRSLLPGDLQPSTRILYGGSMKASNALELLSQPDIDGGLIGGASLKPDEFAKIVAAAADA